MATSAESAAAAEPLLPAPWTVRRVQRETRDVVSLEIEPLDSTPVAVFRPGQFQMLYVFGVGEVPISLAGWNGAGHVLHTIRDVGAVSHALCSLGPGDVLGVRGPFGSDWPIEAAAGRAVVIAAGGIGLAPLRPVIEAIVDQRERYGEVIVLYGAREPTELLYPAQYDRWREAGVQLEMIVDHADHSWDGHVGVVTTLIRNAHVDTEQASAFLCGPEIMMRFVVEEWLRRGVAAEQIFLSMERNMKCAVGLCGHCQLGPEFVCMDGPVFGWPRMSRLIDVREL